MSVREHARNDAQTRAMRDNCIAPLTGKRVDILLLDDDSFERARLRRYIVQSGVRADVVEASCLSTLNDAIKMHTYDVVLVDYRLARDCGFDALDRLRDCTKHRYAGVIMVTGMGGPAIAEEAFRRGCDAFIRKADICPRLLESAIFIAQIAGQARMALSVATGCAARGVTNAIGASDCDDPINIRRYDGQGPRLN